MKLIEIQKELKAPKGQYNNFGKYSYRSCEDILEALKPLLAKYGAALTITDEIVMIGNRFYVKATAKLTADGESVDVCAFAREAETKKGMDESQITGAASSYARKYALNGLFCIDDTKDADTVSGTAPAQPWKMTDDEAATLSDWQASAQVPDEKLLSVFKIGSFEEITKEIYGKMITALKAKAEKVNGGAK